MRFQFSRQLPPHLERLFQMRLAVLILMLGMFLFLVEVWRFSTGRAQPDLLDLPGQPAAQRRDLPDTTPVLPHEEVQERTSAWQSLPLENFAAVRDQTFGVRAAEADGFYRGLALAQRAPAGQLAAAARRDRLHVNLLSDPSRHRGELIGIDGELVRLRQFPAGANSEGLTTLYEGWIVTADSGQRPYRVVSTSLGIGIEPGENLRVPVSSQGYFFKSEGYATPYAVTVVPTLLAQRIDRMQTEFGPPATDELLPYLLGVVGAVGLALLVTVVAYAAGDGRAETARYRLAPKFVMPRLAPESPTADPYDYLVQLSELAAHIAPPVPIVNTVPVAAEPVRPVIRPKTQVLQPIETPPQPTPPPVSRPKPLVDELELPNLNILTRPAGWDED